MLTETSTVDVLRMDWHRVCLLDDGTRSSYSQLYHLLHDGACSQLLQLRSTHKQSAAAVHP
jgi:hypothetical protein